MVGFRRKILTVMGAIGYLVALLLIVIDVLPAYDVPLQSIFIVLGTSSVLLGVDFGIDVLGASDSRPIKPSSDTAIERPQQHDEINRKGGQK